MRADEVAADDEDAEADAEAESDVDTEANDEDDDGVDDDAAAGVASVDAAKVEDGFGTDDEGALV